MFLHWVYFIGPLDQFSVSWVFPGPLGQYLVLFIFITEFGVSEFSTPFLFLSSCFQESSMWVFISCIALISCISPLSFFFRSPPFCIILSFLVFTQRENVDIIGNNKQMVKFHQKCLGWRYATNAIKFESTLFNLWPNKFSMLHSTMFWKCWSCLSNALQM